MKHKGPLMFISLLVITATSLLLLGGCATNTPRLVLDPVGPPPGLERPGATNGTLVVFTAFNVDGVHFSDYKLLSESGTFLKPVRNDSDRAQGFPVSLNLPVGTYRVLAHSNGYGLVAVPVAILGGKVTIVHLDGGGSWPNRAEMIQAGAVRLPDGRVAGWRAEPQNANLP
jgi:hypothetical protein